MWKIRTFTVYTSHLFEKQQVIVPRSWVFEIDMINIYIYIYICHYILNLIVFGDLFDELRVSHFMAYLELYATKPRLSIESSHVWARWGTQHHGGMWLSNMMYRSSPFIPKRIWIKPWYLPHYSIQIGFEKGCHPYYPSYLQVIQVLKPCWGAIHPSSQAKHAMPVVWGTLHQPKWGDEPHVT